MPDYSELKPNSDEYLVRLKDVPPEMREKLDEIAAKQNAESNTSTELSAPTNEQPYKGKVVEKKPSIPEKIFRFFVDEDVTDIGDWIMRRVFKPMVRGWAGEILGSMGDALTRGRYSRYRDDYEEYVSYDNYSNRKRRDYDDDRRPRMRMSNDRVDFREFGFEKRSDAYQALDEMNRCIRRTGKCTVADYYYICARSHVGEYTDRDFGWDSLKGVGVMMRRGMFYIDLPRPIEFE